MKALLKVYLRRAVLVVARRIFLLLYIRSYRRFLRAAGNPESVQSQTLQDILRLSADGILGRNCALTPEDDYELFARKVPIQSYEDLEPWIREQMQVRKALLTREMPRYVEQTSGSSGASKYVPYTGSLLLSFQRAILLWIYDVLRFGPRLQTGRVFYGLSPRFVSSASSQQADEDTSYLGSFNRWVLGLFMVAPPALSRIADVGEFKRALCAILIAEAELEIVSVWSPTYFLQLLDCMAEQRDVLLEDLKRGYLDLPTGRFALAALSPEREAALLQNPIAFDRLWPKLVFISCWEAGPSAVFAARLRAMFPDVLLQGKGLLATEAPMTIPLLALQEGAVPLAGEVFFECERNDGKIFRLHELEDGAEYTLIISQRSGFLRYRIGDRVRVTGKHGNTPLFAFVGRGTACVDLVGEKLREDFVASCLDRLGVLGVVEVLLVPCLPESGAPFYAALFGESVVPPSFEAELEQALATAHHYKLARSLGQLGPLQVYACPDLMALYTAYCIEHGQLLGDVKPRVLLGKCFWQPR